MKISAVIPTRNRFLHLRRTLGSLIMQSRQPDEIIVVDSSDDKLSLQNIRNDFAGHSIRWLDSMPSVCIQRNIGILHASGDWIFLCDDDIELPDDYLQKLVAYADSHPHCGAVAGRLMQLEGGNWVDQYPVMSFLELFWRFIFQLGIWGSIDNVRTHPLLHYSIQWVSRFYNRRGNCLSLAGWPLVTQWNNNVFESRVYSLGANLIRREWISGAYDEVLDPYGIGDNYGAALRFPGNIHVINSTVAYHHRASEGRADQNLVYYRRLLALHYFILRSGQGIVTRLFFVWSLFGNSLMSLLKRDLIRLRINMKVIILILLSRNPYCLGHRRSRRVVEPYY